MSYSPKHHDPDAIKAASITAAIIDGCTCRPDVELTEECPGMFHAQVLHDSWCPLLLQRGAPWN